MMKTEKVELTSATKAWILSEYGKRRAKAKRDLNRAKMRCDELWARDAAMMAATRDERIAEAFELRDLLDADEVTKDELIGKVWDIYQVVIKRRDKREKVSRLARDWWFKVEDCKHELENITEMIADFAAKPCVDEPLAEG